MSILVRQIYFVPETITMENQFDRLILQFDVPPRVECPIVAPLGWRVWVVDMG